MIALSKTLLLLICIGSKGLYATTTITGDSTTSGQTTTFSVGPYHFNNNSGDTALANIFIGANATKTNNKYAVARASDGASALTALAPEKITLDGTEDTTNPLYGAKINFLSVSSSTNPFVVKDGETKARFFTNVSSESEVALITSNNIKDSADATAGSIIALKAHSLAHQAFAAVTNNGGGDFGATGSGIAKLEVSGSTLSVKNDGKAYALNNSSATVKITNDVVLENAVDLHWDMNLQRLYIALQATTGSISGDGARSIVVGKLNSDGDLEFESIAPDAVFSSNDEIVGAMSSGVAKSVSAIKVRTLRTTTNLDYLIVVGGNDAAAAVGNKVYAMPLVNEKDSSTIGHLAKFDSNPTDTFDSNSLFTKREMKTAATAAGDVLTNTSTAAIVGGGDLSLLASESISSLFVSGDSVYATIGTSSVSGAAGFYHSQALFDSNGKIQSWTNWKKIAATTSKIFAGAVDSVKGNYWYLTGADSSNVKTLNQTTWGKNDNDGLLGGTTADETVGLTATLTSLFPSASGGVLNLVPLPSTDAAINSSYSMLIATGVGKVALVETENASGVVSGDFATGLAQSTTDALPAPSSSTILATSGDVLTAVGPITAAHVATQTSTDSWIVVGGSGGVAVLRKSSGASWGSTPLTGINGLSASYAFYALGDYENVRKITSDGTYLYVLTETELDRITLSATNLAATSLTKTTIASTTILDIDSDFVLTDFVVSNEFALLATTAGLYRISNGANIQTAAALADWTLVTVPEGVGPISKIIINSTTGLEKDFSTLGNIYLLGAYRGLHRSQINRFTANLVSSTIDDDTFLALPDRYIQSSLSELINFEAYRDNYLTDGTLYFDTHSKDVDNGLFAHLLPPTAHTGQSVAAKFSYNLPIDADADDSYAFGITQNPANGSWIISGDFGIRTNG